LHVIYPFDLKYIDNQPGLLHELTIHFDERSISPASAAKAQNSDTVGILRVTWFVFTLFSINTLVIVADTNYDSRLSGTTHAIFTRFSGSG
jgi:hypothetical protein